MRATRESEQPAAARARAWWPLLRRSLLLAGFFVLCSWGASTAHADDHGGPVGGLLAGAGKVGSSTGGTVQQGLDDTVGVVGSAPDGPAAGGGDSAASRLQGTVRHAVTNVRTVVRDLGTATEPVTTTVTDTVDRTVSTVEGTVGRVVPATQSQPPSTQPPSSAGDSGAVPGHRSHGVGAAGHRGHPATDRQRSERAHVLARTVHPLGAPRPDHVPALRATGTAVATTATDPDTAVRVPALHHGDAPLPAGPGPFAPQLPAAPSLLLGSASGPLGLLVPSLALALAAGTVVRRTRRSLLVPLGPAFRPAFSPD